MPLRHVALSGAEWAEKCFRAAQATERNKAPIKEKLGIQPVPAKSPPSNRRAAFAETKKTGEAKANAELKLLTLRRQQADLQDKLAGIQTEVGVGDVISVNGEDHVVAARDATIWPEPAHPRRHRPRYQANVATEGGSSSGRTTDRRSHRASGQ